MESLKIESFEMPKKKENQTMLSGVNDECYLVNVLCASRGLSTGSKPTFLTQPIVHSVRPKS